MKVLLSILFIAYLNVSSAQDLSFKIAPADLSFSFSNVNIEITFTNSTPDTINLYNWQHNQKMYNCLGDFLNFQIINNKNDTLTLFFKDIKPKMPYKTDFIALSPGNSYTETINLAEFYHFENDIKKWLPGEYTIIASYEYKHSSSFKYGDNLWQGKVVSNELEIDIDNEVSYAELTDDELIYFYQHRDGILFYYYVPELFNRTINKPEFLYDNCLKNRLEFYQFIDEIKSAVFTNLNDTTTSEFEQKRIMAIYTLQEKKVNSDYQQIHNEFIDSLKAINVSYID